MQVELLEPILNSKMLRVLFTNTSEENKYLNKKAAGFHNETSSLNAIEFEGTDPINQLGPVEEKDLLLVAPKGKVVTVIQLTANNQQGDTPVKMRYSSLHPVKGLHSEPETLSSEWRELVL